MPFAITVAEGRGALALTSRLPLAQSVRTMLSAISSANCNIIAPVAEDPKV